MSNSFAPSRSGFDLSAVRLASDRPGYLTDCLRLFGERQAMLPQLVAQESPPLPRQQYPSYQDLVLALGTIGMGSVLPAQVSAWPAEHPGFGALDLVRRYPTVIYCEGYALHAGGVQPVLHAWVMTKAGRIVDRCWLEGEANVYYGLAFDIADVERCYADLDVRGIIASDHTRDYALLRTGRVLPVELQGS